MHNPDLIGNGADILSVCGQGPFISTLHCHRVYLGPRVPAGGGVPLSNYMPAALGDHLGDPRQVGTWSTQLLCWLCL